MTDKFTVRGVDWHDKEMPGVDVIRAVRGRVGDISIYVLHLDTGFTWFRSGEEIEAPLKTAFTIEKAAEQAFDACHLRASNLCQAFLDAIKKEQSK